MIKFSEYFNFDDIKGYDEISENLAAGHKFLASNFADKSSGQIERI